MSPRSISRRRFLRAGCLGVAAVGVTVCSGAGLVAALRPDPPPVDLASFSYGEQTGDKVLIAYASATGSTVDIAAAIGRTLGERGFAIDIHPVKKKPSVDGFQAVLVGSAVQGGNWLPEAVDFVQANQPDLNRLPVALFSVHFFNRGEDAKSEERRLAYLDTVRPLVPMAATAFFAGRFDQRTTAMGLPSWLAHLTPTMDFRDWEAIRAWAQAYSPQLTSE
jgi:menaquinone-dependent protoporphyrinogen oxidase